jgi:hypothetical protein
MIQPIKVFLASPGDVTDERLAVRSIVQEENSNHFIRDGYELHVIGWDTDSSPGKGQPHPQGRINPLISECQLFIGIFWVRYGSPTGESASGTEEEYNCALDLLSKPELPLCDIKIYFCDRPLKPSNIDPHQLIKVNEFKKKIQEKDRLLTGTILDIDQFKIDFRRHLNEWFQKYIQCGGDKKLFIKTEPQKPVFSEESLSSKFKSMTKGF